MKPLSCHSNYTKIPAPNIHTLRSHIPVIPIKYTHHPQYTGHPGINGDGAATAITIPTLHYLQIISEANAASC
jgi:hypothetical protein